MAEGLAGQLWAALMLVAWGAAAWVGVRKLLFPDWHWPERLALAYALAAAGLTSTTVIFARQLGLGFYGGGSCALLVGVSVVAACVRLPDPTREECRPAGRGARFWWTLAAGNVPVALIAFTNHSVDWIVHHWNAAAIQNDGLPLPYPTYPGMTVAYHYAIDLFAAVVGLAIPIDPEWIFDGLSLVAWNASALLCTGLVVAIRAMPRTRALEYVLAFALLGGGLMWLLFPLAQFDAGPSLVAVGLDPALFIAGVWGPLSAVGREVVNFPVLHYFFNLPFALGFPLGFAALHLFAALVRSRARAHAVVCSLLLGALSFAHVAVFLVLACVFGLFALIDAIAQRSRSIPNRGPHLLLVTGALGFGALVLAFLQGGVFSGSDGGFAGGSIVWFPGYRAENPLSLLLYFAAVFGISGALGLAGVFRAARDGSTVGLLLSLIAVVGLAVPQLVWYTQSPVDNFKFYTIASVALGLLAAIPLENLRERLPGAAGSCLVVSLSLASMGTPLLHSAARLATAPDYVLVVNRKSQRTGMTPRRAWPAETAAAHWLRGEMEQEDLLIALPNGIGDTVRVLAHSGHFGAQASFDGYPGIALSKTRVAARRQWLERAHRLDAAALCEPEGLWVYVREDLLNPRQLALLGRAVSTGALRPMYRDEGTEGRRVVFEACPGRPEAIETSSNVVGSIVVGPIGRDGGGSDERRVFVGNRCPDMTLETAWDS